MPGITLHGPSDPDRRGAVISFALDAAHPHDVAEILGRDGVCVRAGHHCAQPLMRAPRHQRHQPRIVRRALHPRGRRPLVAGLHRVQEVFA